VEGLAERLPIEIEATVTSGRFPAEVELASYYVVAEALTNVAKHAGIAEARVAVEQSNGELRIAVTDDGRGGARMAAGSGLEGLADRVAAVGGRLIVDSPSGGGTRVEAVIPCR
jgi:signal transduction histidine kinase